MMRRYLVVQLCVAGALVSFATFAVQTSPYEVVSLCHVLKDPQAYVNKKISFRGSVYVGMENTNISDGKCPGKAVYLKVGDDVYRHADIRVFHRKITGWKMRGFATVFGTFSVTEGSLTPFTLNVERVTNVTPSDKKLE